MKVSLTLTFKRIHCLLCVLCGALILSLCTIHSIIYNVHLSPYYVQQRARLFPAKFNISQQCSWNTKPHNFSDYKPTALMLIANALSDVYAQSGIMSVLRDGSLLHTYRHIRADVDMDIWMIIPKNMTMDHGYGIIKKVLKSNTSYSNLEFEHQNMAIMSILFHFTDSTRFSYKGVKVCDISVLHETFINDPDTQAPCRPLDCDLRIDDVEFTKKFHLMQTKALFENLCKCRFMDAELFCVSAATEYLQLQYGDNFTIPYNKKKFRERTFVYERPFGVWRNAIGHMPSLREIKRLFEGHQDEDDLQTPEKIVNL